MNAWQLSPGYGVKIGIERNRRRGAAPTCLWCSRPAKPSNSIGARTGVTPKACFQHDIALWTETPHKALPGSIADVWEAEKPTLMALPPAFDGFIEHSKRVSPTCLITFERNRYSVPASFANRRVSLHVYPERLIMVAEGQTVCKHARIIERSHPLPRQCMFTCMRGGKPGKVIYDWRHYLALAIVLGPMADKGSLQRKPGALRNGAPFTEMPDAFRQLQDHMLRKEGGDREMVDILSLVLQHNEEDVLCAVELALEAGVPTKTHILNLLHRLIDRRPIDHPEVDPPDALALQTTPVANVGRYDGLRQTEEKRHAS